MDGALVGRGVGEQVAEPVDQAALLGDGVGPLGVHGGLGEPCVRQPEVAAVRFSSTVTLPWPMPPKSRYSAMLPLATKSVRVPRIESGSSRASFSRSTATC